MGCVASSSTGRLTGDRRSPGAGGQRGNSNISTEFQAPGSRDQIDPFEEIRAMSRLIFGRLCIAAVLMLSCDTARAQAEVVFLGFPLVGVQAVSTIQGDWARGLGSAAFGLGLGHYYDAVADSVEAETGM